MGGYFIKLFTPLRAILHLTLVGYALFTITFFVEERFRIPILPVMFILFAAILIQLWHDVTTKLRLSQPARLAVLSAGLLGIFVIYVIKTIREMTSLNTKQVMSC